MRSFYRVIRDCNFDNTPGGLRKKNNLDVHVNRASDGPKEEIEILQINSLFSKGKLISSKGEVSPSI